MESRFKIIGTNYKIKERLITKARKDENTKSKQDKFRAFRISCFRDENNFA